MILVNFFLLFFHMHIAHLDFLFSRAPSGWLLRGTVPGGRPGRAGCQNPFRGLLYHVLLAAPLLESIQASCWRLSPPWVWWRQIPVGAAAACPQKGRWLQLIPPWPSLPRCRRRQHWWGGPGHSPARWECQPSWAGTPYPVGWVEHNAAREGGLKATSAAGYGRYQNLAKILVATVLQVGFIPATFAGDVASEWQSAYQGHVGAHISQRDQLVQQLLQPGLRGGYQAT